MTTVDFICMPFFIFICWFMGVYFPMRIYKDEPSKCAMGVRIVFGAWYLFVMAGLIWSAP